MTTMTIPKSLMKNDDLVVLPRKTYESLLRSASKKIMSSKIDKDLLISILEYQAGKISGPFRSISTFKKSLES